MENRILGLHHVTAIAGNAQRNLDFYTQTLGLRFVKKTVNFDDPTTYHFYFGDYAGSAGTILTFFPWEGMRPGSRGVGETATVSFSVPAQSLAFWQKQIEQNGIASVRAGEKFGEEYLSFTDPDGMGVELIVAKNADTRAPYTKADFTDERAIRGFHNVTLVVRDRMPTAELLTGIFGYRYQHSEGSIHRYITDAVANAGIVDIIEQPAGYRATQGAGSIHHVAFRVKDDATQVHFQTLLREAGFHVTPQIDRDYFHSVYFRETGGVLFEIATDTPGFAVDEPLDKLGTSLRLPKQHEPRRNYIEAQLPKLREETRA